MAQRQGSFPTSRREFIIFFGGSAAAWPLAARAQQPNRMRRIGVLASKAEDDPMQRAELAAFRGGLERLGWSEGRNIHIDYRFARGSSIEAEALAKELVALRPDAMVSEGTGTTAALQRESRTIPIVFVGVSDPVGSGFIAGLARPGGNLTGLLLMEASITGKWLAMLKEIAPRVERAAFMANPKTSPYDYFLRVAKATAPSLGIELVSAPVENAADVERTVDSFAREPNGGLVLPTDATTIVHRDLILALAARYHLPAVYPQRYFVDSGGLMSYGVDFVDLARQAATYIDRILRGEKPADLPVQTPVKYETVINLKTAKALGLIVPDLLLVRADEVIE